MIAAWLLVAVVAGCVVAWVWQRRDEAARFGLLESRRERRNRRARQLVALSMDALYAGESKQALGYARRAHRAHRNDPPVHACLARAWFHQEAWEQAMRHHRHCEYLAMHQEVPSGLWRYENAVGAARTSLVLHDEATTTSQAQAWWDEAAQWMALARTIDAEQLDDDAQQDIQLARLNPTEACLPC